MQSTPNYEAALEIIMIIPAISQINLASGLLVIEESRGSWIGFLKVLSSVDSINGQHSTPLKHP